MSFAFSVVKKTKEEVKEAIIAAMVEVVKTQPAHERDRSLVNATAAAYIDMLDEPPEGQSINVSVNGSVGWKHNPDSPYAPAEGQMLSSAGVGVQAWFVMDSGV